MTLPYEEKYSINQARQFLYDLTNPKKVHRIPKAVRDEAFRLLHHYPHEYRVEEYFKAERTLGEKDGDSKGDIAIRYGKNK